MVGTRHRLVQVDYRDRFVQDVDDAAARPATDWARLVLEGAPAPLRRGLLTAWTALRVDLDPHDSNRVLGWAIADSSDDSVVLAARSALGVAVNLVLTVEPPQLVLATLIEYERRTGRVAWAGVAPVHRRVVPYLLAHAARSGRRA